MPSALQGVFIYILLPVVAMIVGGAAAAFRVPGPRVQSSIQHFAAGVVFAAVAGEILPEITHQRDPLDVIIGFALGVAAMLGVRWLTEKFGQPGEQTEKPTGLLVAVAVDLLIDGLLVGIGFAAGAENGILLTIALTIEILFLGLSTAAALAKAGANRSRVMITTVALALVVAVGAGVGVTLLSGLSGGALELVLSFGAAALLYLVTEELLVEAHEVPETPMTTAMFFLGFLVLFVIEIIAMPATT
jgi:ZIP family zinc transporter